jgi:FkbH-like protein
VRIDYSAADDPRVLELINKTNQFNLNGIRYSEAEWRERLASPGSEVAAISYQDKFGPLGRIAVLAGTVDGDALKVFSWVLSCRAFSRRIEHHVLASIFETLSVNRMEFDFTATAKNGPLREFFASILGATPAGTISLTREQFEKNCPLLPHAIQVDRKTAGAQA